jgi:hypothetical protein
VVAGELIGRFAPAIDGMSVQCSGGQTEITGMVVDQSQLHGLLDRGDNDLAQFWTCVLAALCRSGAVAADDQLQATMLADDRRPRFALILAICRLLRARRAGDLDEVVAAGCAVLEAHGQFEGNAGAAGLAAEARAVALSGLGPAELWSGDLDAAGAHLRAGRVAAL